MNHCTGTIDNGHQYIEFEGLICPLCEVMRDNKSKDEDIRTLSNELREVTGQRDHWKKEAEKLKEGG